ncbi:MAG: hypothetical protein IJZ69_05040 [Bacteroidales bacterium]|nr:hypothetical protein [Bacteroidales bacterium]
MCRLIDDIAAFLEGNGFECSRQMRHDFDVICTKTLDGRYSRIIMPLEITARSREEAGQGSEEASYAIRMITRESGYPLIIAEDRWKRQRKMMEARLLAHLELFSQAYARNCEVRRIDKAEAKAFLAGNHSYGYAACRYCYGLFLKRHTGHIAEETSGSSHIGKMIAVATFSNARKWMKDGKEIRSYEWTRYASLPEMRVSGGMGKLLKAFIKEVQPDDIMSYADLEWSEGDVYRALGFEAEMEKEAVDFVIDGETWERSPIRSGKEGNLFFRNFGSRKFRMKLTDYK